MVFTFSNGNTFRNVAIANSNNELIIMNLNTSNNLSFHSTKTIDNKDQVDIINIKNILNKDPNNDLHICAYNGNVINPIIKINNTNSNCTMTSNLNIGGNLNVSDNLVVDGTGTFNNNVKIIGSNSNLTVGGIGSFNNLVKIYRNSGLAFIESDTNKNNNEIHFFKNKNKTGVVGVVSSATETAMYFKLDSDHDRIKILDKTTNIYNNLNVNNNEIRLRDDEHHIIKYVENLYGKTVNGPAILGYGGFLVAQGDRLTNSSDGVGIASSYIKMFIDNNATNIYNTLAVGYRTDVSSQWHPSVAAGTDSDAVIQMRTRHHHCEQLFTVKNSSGARDGSTDETLVWKSAQAYLFAKGGITSSRVADTVLHVYRNTNDCELLIQTDGSPNPNNPKIRFKHSNGDGTIKFLHTPNRLSVDTDLQLNNSLEVSGTSTFTGISTFNNVTTIQHGGGADYVFRINTTTYIAGTDSNNPGVGGFWALRWSGPADITSNFNMEVWMGDNDDGIPHQIGRFENDDQDTGSFFTGQHSNILNTHIGVESVGLIVYSTGNYININNSLNPTINESLPICEITNTDNNKSVFGVISNKEDADSTRKGGTGSYKTISRKANINEQRIIINSVGEGSIWVCNKTGVLENGDYITSSTVKGYGMKQILNEEFLTRYTIAKITCNCDFNLTKIVKQKLRVLNNNGSNEIDYDSNGDVQYEDDLDSNGIQQMIYKYETRFLDANGVQLSGGENDYITRLSNGENVYIACFVGCTYHCG